MLVSKHCKDWKKNGAYKIIQAQIATLCWKDATDDLPVKMATSEEVIVIVGFSSFTWRNKPETVLEAHDTWDVN